MTPSKMSKSITSTRAKEAESSKMRTKEAAEETIIRTGVKETNLKAMETNKKRKRVRML